jgi:biopolymer transport protein ExbD
MNLSRKTKFTAEVYTGSLNDIMFFLLLFFLIVATMVNPNVIKLLLPTATTAQSMTTKQINLSITADKKYYIEKQEVPIENLEATLNAKCKTVKEPTIILRIDGALTVQDLVDVLQIGTKINVKMVLATKSPQK